jgi:hypothetical protein
VSSMKKTNKIDVAPFIHLNFQGCETKVVYNIHVHQMPLLSNIEKIIVNLEKVIIEVPNIFL